MYCKDLPKLCQTTELLYNKHWKMMRNHWIQLWYDTKNYGWRRVLFAKTEGRRQKAWVLFMQVSLPSLYLVTSPVQKFDWSNQLQDLPVLHTNCNLSECWQICSTKQASVFSNDLSNHLLCFQHKWTEETFPPLHKIYIEKDINVRGQTLNLKPLRMTYAMTGHNITHNGLLSS